MLDKTQYTDLTKHVIRLNLRFKRVNCYLTITYNELYGTYSLMLRCGLDSVTTTPVKYATVKRELELLELTLDALASIQTKSEVQDKTKQDDKQQTTNNESEVNNEKP